MLIDRIDRFEAFHSDDVLLKLSSFHWISCVIFLIRATLVGAVRLISMRPPTAEHQLRLIDRYNVTFVHNSPHLTAVLSESGLLAAANLASLRRYIAGGAKVKQAHVDHINGHLPNGTAHVSYGLSEAAGIVSLDYPVARGRGTVGRLLSGLCAKIVDDNGNRCGPNQPGELCLKVAHRILGYYKDPAANRRLLDAEGFLLTGDIGHIDETGYLFICDRKTDMLRGDGAMLRPSLIEEHLLRSRLIEAACVVGIPDGLNRGRDHVAVAIIRKGNAVIDQHMVHKMIEGESVCCLIISGIRCEPDIIVGNFNNCLFRAGIGWIQATWRRSFC